MRRRERGCARCHGPLLHCLPTPGTERARASAQTLLDVPYGSGDREKLDIYFPTDPSESEWRGWRGREWAGWTPSSSLTVLHSLPGSGLHPRRILAVPEVRWAVDEGFLGKRPPSLTLADPFS